MERMRQGQREKEREGEEEGEGERVEEDDLSTDRIKLWIEVSVAFLWDVLDHFGSLNLSELCSKCFPLVP